MADVHTIAPVDLKKIDHSFGIVTSKRQYYVRASSAKEMQEWVEALRRVREQVRQRSTITRDMAYLDMSSSNAEGMTSSGDLATPKQRSPTSGLQIAAAQPMSVHQHPDGTTTPTAASSSGTNQGGGGGVPAAPISIVIPGKGLYTSPAQPRVTGGGRVMSPLSATSESDTGAPSGAEQLGMSYTSSAGQSFSSSPGRVHYFDRSSGGSPQNLSGGDDGYDSQRRSRASKQAAQGYREASAGSSGGEQGDTGDLHGQSGAQQMQVLSSSDEDGEGDDWDEEEEADRAMPLPSHTPGAGHATLQPPSTGGQQGTSSLNEGAGATGSTAASGAKSKVASEFFKDANKIIHQGYLMKQSSRRKHWRKRWFTLTSGHLSYSRSHMDSKAHRRIPITSILDAIEYTPKKSSSLLPPLSPSLGGVGGGGPTSPGAGASSLGSVAPFTFSPRTAEGAPDVFVESPVGNPAGPLPSSADAAVASLAERRSATTPSISLAAAPSLMASPQHAATTPGGGASTKRKKENCFKIITPKRTFLVCAPTEEDEIKWLSALQALLRHWRESQEGGGAAGQGDSGVQSLSDRSAGAEQAPSGQTQQQVPGSSTSAASLQGGNVSESTAPAAAAAVAAAATTTTTATPTVAVSSATIPSAP